MNLPSFLHKVDDITSDLTKDQLQRYIHEIARTLPESKRQDFIDKLSLYTKDKDKSCTIIGEDKHKDDLIKKIKTLADKVRHISDSNRCINSELNEEWDDWYNSDEDEFFFTDDQGVLKDINNAIGLVHEAIDNQLYEEGRILAESILSVRVEVDGDYSDYMSAEFDISELYDNDLLNVSRESFGRECIYTIYKSLPLEDRARAIYSCIGKLHIYSINLEFIMQMGDDEISDFNDFILLWIDYLNEGDVRSKWIADKMLDNAITLISNPQTMLDNARKYGDVHPELYVKYIESQNGILNPEHLISVCQEAMDAIPVNCIVRAKVSFWYSKFESNLGDDIKKKYGFIEAYRSETNEVNLLRILFFSQVSSEKEISMLKDIASTVKAQSPEKRTSYLDGDSNANALSDYDYYSILFWLGDISEMIQKGMQVKVGIGWSETFMKKGLALLLLLLFEEDRYTKGILEILSRVENDFNLDNIIFGENDNKTKDLDKDIFTVELLESLRKRVALNRADKEKLFKKIDKWIQMRVDAIMNANRRNYYHECAMYIAAFGEVLEVNGVVGAKMEILLRYKNTYSRRRAFIDELKGFGLRK